MIRTVPMLACLLALAACNQPSTEAAVIVEDAVVTLPVVPGRPGAAYFTVRTSGPENRLMAIASPRIGRIELHETVTENQVSRMVPLRDSTITAGRPLKFEPGGGHAMLFEIDPSLTVGGTVPLVFHFDPAEPVTVEAQVRSAGDTGHSGH